MLSRYDIVLVAFPFTDGPAAKPRPALVITTNERHGDVLLAFIGLEAHGAPNNRPIAEQSLRLLNRGNQHQPALQAPAS
ncbi:MAG: hypothetical protein ACKO8I_05190 [Cyanobacteriota bacterium]